MTGRQPTCCIRVASGSDMKCATLESGSTLSTAAATALRMVGPALPLSTAQAYSTTSLNAARYSCSPRDAGVVRRRANCVARRAALAARSLRWASRLACCAPCSLSVSSCTSWVGACAGRSGELHRQQAHAPKTPFAAKCRYVSEGTCSFAVATDAASRAAAECAAKRSASADTTSAVSVPRVVSEALPLALLATASRSDRLSLPQSVASSNRHAAYASSNGSVACVSVVGCVGGCACVSTTARHSKAFN